MSDDFNTAVPGETPDPVTFAKKPGSASGTLVRLVIALGVCAIIAGIVVAIVVFVGGGQASSDAEVSKGSGTSTDRGAVGEPVTLTASQPAPAVTNAEVFTFRDIFDPLLDPIPVEPTPSANDTETPTSTDTLYLDDIITEDGVLKAVLRLNGTTYTRGPGETISGTPWKVLAVTSTQVTMLYGDTQVTLTVGQGITK